jgi:hypothetical protein
MTESTHDESLPCSNCGRPLDDHAGIGLPCPPARLSGAKPGTDQWRLDSAINCLREIANLSKKMGSEMAASWLAQHGYPRDPGGYVPGKGFADEPSAHANLSDCDYCRGLKYRGGQPHCGYCGRRLPVDDGGGIELPEQTSNQKAEQMSDEHLRNTRAWAARRIGQLSGAEVIVAAIDELLERRSRVESAQELVHPCDDGMRVVECPECHGVGGGLLPNGEEIDCGTCDGDGSVLRPAVEQRVTEQRT